MRISVAIANFQYGRYLGQALDSVLAQTWPAAEIVVVDDGSTDESRDVLARYGAPVVAILTDNHGQAAATNRALEACTGDVVALLDSDDLMAPDRLERLAAVYAAEPAACWVCHGIEHVDRETLLPVPAPPAIDRVGPGPHDLRAVVRRGRLPLTVPATSALSWRLPFLRQLLPVPAGVRLADNYLMFASMARGPGFVIDRALVRQGMHETNMYTGLAGPRRRALRAGNAAAMVGGFERLGPDLHPLADRLTADALRLSGLGRTLPEDLRRDVVGRVRRLPLRRRARVGAHLVVGAVRAAVR